MVVGNLKASPKGKGVEYGKLKFLKIGPLEVEKHQFFKEAAASDISTVEYSFVCFALK